MIIYRGVDDKFKPERIHIEKGFIATSLDKNVATKFATDGKTRGILQVFAVSSLPKDVPFILIDESIDSVFNEQEIVLLPGTVTVVPLANKNFKSNSAHHIVQVEYKPDIEFVQIILNKPAPRVRQHLGGELMFELGHTLEDLCCRDIVYYRAIIGRDPEILAVLVR